MRQTFGGQDIIYNLEEFEGEKDVQVMTADDFITRCYEIGVKELDHVQIECLMRVLGKPELSNAIKLVDLETLMSNIGPPSPREEQQNDEQQLQHSQQPNMNGNFVPQFEGASPNNQQTAAAEDNGKPKQNKLKTQISNLIESQPQLIKAITSVIDAVGLADLKQRINEKVYKIDAKRKTNGKQVNESIINKQDLLDILKSINGEGLTDEMVELIQPLVQVNQNHGHIYRQKIVNFLIDETQARAELMKDANVEQTQNGA